MPYSHIFGYLSFSLVVKKEEVVIARMKFQQGFKMKFVTFKKVFVKISYDKFYIDIKPGKIHTTKYVILYNNISTQNILF